MIIHKEGDLLNSNIQYIAHQCNCVGTMAGGLAFYLFKKYPYADTYSTKHTIEKSKLGTIDILGNDEEQKVINMYSQYYPGHHTNYETEEIRIKAFKTCLNKIMQISDLKEIAFPFQIGCGLAGGNWEVYSSILEQFSNIIPEVKTYIFKLLE